MIMIALAVMVAWTSVVLAQAGDFLKLRQSFNGGYSLIYNHNSRFVVSQVTYNSQQTLVLGAGPSTRFQLGKVGISASAYADVTLNLKDTNFPIQSYMGELFVIGNLGKWSLFTRSASLTDAKSLDTSFSGMVFLGHQLEKCNIRVLSNWRQEKVDSGNKTEYRINAGPSIEYKINDTSSISGYIGADTKSPHPKTGWLELKVKL
ncbi:MAG TPA: hypothetical protein PLP46_02485 [bacterium]|nr:hypothetical protein [bacterium]